MKFEGVKCSVPNNPGSFLTSSYGDYMELPKDIHSHFQHINHDKLDSPEAKEVFEGLIGKEER